MLQHQPEEQAILQETPLPLANTEDTVAPAALSDAEVEALIAQFKKRTASASRRFLPGAVWRILLGSVIGSLIGYWIALVLTTPLPFLFLLAAGVVAILYHLYFALPRRLHKAQRAEDLRRMEASGDPRFIEPLADAWLNSGNVALSYEIAPVMTQLVSQTDAAQANQLSPKTRKNLIKTLQIAPLALSRLQEKTYKVYYANYTAALVQMLTRLEATEAIRYLRPLTKLRGKESYLEEVRKTAQESLEILERKAKENQQTGTLLRPVEGSHLPTEQLLRPVEASAEKSPETLLRLIEKE